MQQRRLSEIKPQSLTTLSEARIGAAYRLIRIENPQDPHVLRLCEMGLVPGSLVTLLRKGRSGTPLLVRANQTDLCLDEVLADYFVVEESETALPGDES